MFKVIICGSRDFTNYDLLKKKCDKILEKRKEKGEEIVIISGCSRGADTLGEKYAKENGYEVLRFPADWEKYKKRAGYIRNEKMAEEANACIAFLQDDKECKGTKNMISIARKKNLLIREITEKIKKENENTKI